MFRPYLKLEELAPQLAAGALLGRIQLSLARERGPLGLTEQIAADA